MLQTIKRHLRLWVQVLFTALTNGYLLGFTKGKIYRGPSKQVCVPGLNCYSCPGAVGPSAPSRRWWGERTSASPSMSSAFS